MRNSELRCASTTLESPDFRAEAEEAARRAARLVELDQTDNAVRLFHHAANELAFGRFKSPEAALEFVFDAVL